MTVQEQASEALGHAGERLAGAEATVRGAISGLNDAIDLAHTTRVEPEAAHGLVTAGATLGVLGEGYLAHEIRAWDAIYGPGRPPASEPGEFRDLHLRPRPLAAPETASSREAAAEALTRAGVQLAQAEIGLEKAFCRLDEAAGFARAAGLPRDAVHGLVTTRASPGVLGSDYLAKEIGVWDTMVASLAEVRADGRVPPEFWELDLRAHAAKGTGCYPAAAAIWQLASSLLPAGHEMREDLDRMITSLRTAARTGQSVTWDGHLVTSRAEPGRVARDTPALDQLQDLHDAARRYPDAPWGRLAMRARADAQYAEWHRHYRDRPEILEEIERFRSEAGDLHAAHPIFLGFLERRIAEKLRGQQGARLQAGAGGPGPAAAAPEAPWLAGISFPGPVQPSPPPRNGRKTSRTAPPPGQRATRGWGR
jgi:hypothetical protein